VVEPKQLVFILARQFASNLATPRGITDEQGGLKIICSLNSRTSKNASRGVTGAGG